MVHSSISDLQRDTRQDEYPTTYRGNQDEFPTTVRVHSPRPQFPSTPSLPTPTSSTDERIFRLRKTTFWLSLLATTMLVLGIVGSTVAGSIAMNRKSSSGNVCKPEQSAQSEHITSILSSASSQTSNVMTTPLQSSSTPILPSPTSAAPSDSARALTSCQDVQTPYLAKIPSVQFDIHCETQNLGGDFMNLVSATLENCIEACASFNYWTGINSYDTNLRCSIVNYDDFMSLGGNCWLKGSGGHPQPAARNESVTSASLRGGV